MTVLLRNGKEVIVSLRLRLWHHQQMTSVFRKLIIQSRYLYQTYYLDKAFDNMEQRVKRQLVL